MFDHSKKALDDYKKLEEYSQHRSRELAAMSAPYIECTDTYGQYVCRLTNVLGRIEPGTVQDKAIRDLMADVFDMLYESRIIILKSKLEVAYPLIRRAYESLSLMALIPLDEPYATRWQNGEKIKNSEIRDQLDKHEMGERAEGLREAYKFFSLAAHPNRDMIPERFLGQGNKFTLGAIGMPDLVMVTDYMSRHLNLWFWFAAVLAYYYRNVIDKFDAQLAEEYFKVAAKAKEVSAWLNEQHNNVLKEHRERHS